MGAGHSGRSIGIVAIRLVSVDLSGVRNLPPIWIILVSRGLLRPMNVELFTQI